jgi:hypothetical protein
MKTLKFKLSYKLDNKTNKRRINMQLTFLGSGGGRFRDHNPEEDDRRI